MFCDLRIGGIERWYLQRPEDYMVVPQEMQKCVGFVGYQKADGSFQFAGTVFFVGRKMARVDRAFSYAVTARHVIDSIRTKGISEVLLRMNRCIGDSVWVRTETRNWVSHATDPSVDVSVVQFGFDDSFDHNRFTLDGAATEGVIKAWGIDVGDEVFLTGLFAPHFGHRKNIPIVRVGNISAMLHEKVSTAFREIDAYLIEARSIGGLSGSPVFVNVSGVRHGTLSPPQIYLLGPSCTAISTRSSSRWTYQRMQWARLESIWGLA
jgi:hypothetical protein